MLLIIFFNTSVGIPISTGIAFEFTLKGQASLMLGWTILLIWAQIKPIERKEILLFTSIMIAAGLLINISNILHPYQLTCIFTMLIYFVAYLVATNLKKKQDKEE
jgi:hypothetical protein